MNIYEQQSKGKKFFYLPALRCSFYKFSFRITSLYRRQAVLGNEGTPKNGTRECIEEKIGHITPTQIIENHFPAAQTPGIGKRIFKFFLVEVVQQMVGNYKVESTTRLVELGGGTVDKLDTIGCLKMLCKFNGSLVGIDGGYIEV